MQTIVTRACNELGIKPVPSKRVRFDFYILFALSFFIIF